MRIYVGAPIDNSRPEHSPQEQFQEVAEVVVAGFHGECVIFNPFAAFHNAGQSTNVFDLAFVMHVNQVAITACHIGVFVWNGSPSFGMPLEIQYCVDHRMNTVVVNTTGKPLGLYLRTLELQGKLTIVSGLGGLLEWLLAQNTTVKSDES